MKKILRIKNHHRKRARKHAIRKVKWLARRRNSRRYSVKRTDKAYKPEPVRRRASAQSFRRPPEKRIRITRVLGQRFPEKLSILENTEETLEFFQQIRNEPLPGGIYDYIVDTNHSKEISPEAGLVLIAELTRFSKFLAKDCSIAIQRPKVMKVEEMLTKIGFFSYVSGYKGAKFPDSLRKIYLVNQTANVHNPRILRDLIEHFKKANLTDFDTKPLFKALSECLANVMHHAYPDNSIDTLSLVKKWWLLGSRDMDTDEISFCFFDQGVGIGRTIRTRLRDRMGFLSRSDCELISYAVTHGGYSSTKVSTRGKGLPSLKKFIDSAPRGQLTIVSHKSKCIFTKGNEPIVDELKVGINGTLIVWTLQPHA